jgi:hypothetical protein
LHKEAEPLTNLDIRNATQRFREEVPCDLPETTRQLQLPRDAAPIPFLALHHDGYRYRFCPSARPYVFSNIDNLIEHLRVVHQWSRRPGHQSASYQPAKGLAQAACFPIAYQTFYKRRDFMWYFQVQPDAPAIAGGAGGGVAAAAVAAPAGSIQQGIQQELEGGGIPPAVVATPLSIAEQIELQLTQKLNAATIVAVAATTAGERHCTQASPWLDVTQWPGYLRQHDPLQAT